MKRVDLILHLEAQRCEKLREGSNHTIYVPRHREINDYVARKICRDLEVPEP